MKRTDDIIVIGGGPAGMTAAITAVRRGRSVTLLEGGARVGKKLLSTGNGKCNFTNEKMDCSCYYGEHDTLVSSVLTCLSNTDLISLMRRAGIESKSSSGRVYPRSEQASSVLDALRLQMDLNGVRVCVQEKVQYIRSEKDGLFSVHTADSEFSARRVILAAGGKAAAKTGSDGSGYVLAKQMGLHIVKPLPALTSMKLSEPFCKSWNGVRCDGAVSVIADGEEKAHEIGQLQLTSYGISGIPVFQVSRFASRALDDGLSVKVQISFMPEMTEEDVYKLLTERTQTVGEYPAGELLLGVVPKNLAGVLLRLSGLKRDVTASRIPADTLRSLAAVMTHLTCRVEDVSGFMQAQVSTGGIDVNELVPGTLECVNIPGLYAAGEIIDVDGMCGGYNLQWAFSSGYTAGLAAAE